MPRRKGAEIEWSGRNSLNRSRYRTRERAIFPEIEGLWGTGDPSAFNTGPISGWRDMPVISQNAFLTTH
jgi:hypothetical protein